MKKKEREYQKHLAESNINKAKKIFLFLLTHFYSKFKLDMHLNYIKSYSSTSNGFTIPHIRSENKIQESKIPTTVKLSYRTNEFINIHYRQYKIRTKKSRNNIWSLPAFAGDINRNIENKNGLLKILPYTNRLISEFNSNMDRVSSYSFDRKQRTHRLNFLNLQSTASFKYLFFKKNNFILNYEKDTFDEFYFFDSKTLSFKKIFSLEFTKDKTEINIIKNPNLNIIKFNDVIQTFNKFIFNIAINF